MSEHTAPFENYDSDFHYYDDLFLAALHLSVLAVESFVLAHFCCYEILDDFECEELD